jgi:hypothetical protein
MKWASVAFLTVTLNVGAQPPEALELARQTQSRGYWVDPSSGLTWAGKDNAKDVGWGKARDYCRDLRLAGYSDWRLPTTEELEGIYDRSAYARGLVGGKGKYKNEPYIYQVKGGLFLTGRQWSSSLLNDDRGRSISIAQYFDFTRGPTQFSHEDSSRFGGSYNLHALCVRRS